MGFALTGAALGGSGWLVWAAVITRPRVLIAHSSNHNMGEFLSNLSPFSPLSVSPYPNPFSSPGISTTQVRGLRARTLELSRLKELERCYASSANALDVSHGDGKFLLSGGGDGSLNIHGLTKDSRSVKQTIPVLGKVTANSRFAHEYAVSAVQFYPHDPGVFVSGGKDGKVKLWDTSKMVEVFKFAFDLPVLDLSMSVLTSAKPLIAVAGMDKTTRICDIRTTSSSHTLQGHTRPVTSTRWSRHSPFVLATGGADGKIALWDVRKARSCFAYLDLNNNPVSSQNAVSLNTAHQSSVISLEFVEDGAHLVSYGADHRLRLWSTVSGKNTGVNYGKILFAFKDMNRHLQMSVTTLARPDLVFVPSDDKVQVFDIFSGEKVATLMAHFGEILTCAYHPQFQYLFSGATDRNILLWAPSGDYKEYLFEEEEAKRRDLEKSNRRLASTSAQSMIQAQLDMDTWSDEE